jgi:predicted Zn finger-like uncharacterized protein
MSVQLRCPECRTQLTVPESLLGKTLRCKSCGETFKAKAPSGSAGSNRSRDERADEEADRPRRRQQPPPEERPRPDRRPEPSARPPRPASRRDEEEAEEADERPTRKAGKKRRKKKSPVLYIVGVLIALLIAAGAVVVVVRSRTDLDDLAEQEREAAKPAGPRAIKQEDLSEHIRLTFVQYGILQDDRPAAILRAEFLSPQRFYDNYTIVTEEDDGKGMRRHLDPGSIKDGKAEVTAAPRDPASRTIRLRVWIAKQKPGGKADELVRVSNVVRVPS